MYLDSNVFIYAALSTDDVGIWTRELVRDVRKGDKPAMTSALTFDEFFWKVEKERAFDQAVTAGEALLETPNLRFIRVDDEILWAAFNLIKKYKLDPRDGIHAASAITHGVYTIISEDTDFDKIPELNRTWKK